MTILNRLKQSAQNFRSNLKAPGDPKYIDAIFYVRCRHFVTPSIDDAFELSLILNTYPMTSWGVERPSEPCISQGQYDRLPDSLKGFFSAKPMKIKRI